MNKEMQKRRDKFAWVDKMGGGHIRQDVQLGWDKCAEIYEKEKIAPLVEAIQKLMPELYCMMVQRRGKAIRLDKVTKDHGSVAAAWHNACETLKRLGFTDHDL